MTAVVNWSGIQARLDLARQATADDVIGSNVHHTTWPKSSSPEPHRSSEAGMTLRRTAHATLDLPSRKVDLDSWLFGLSDEEYQACARGHRAAGVYTDELGRGSINVESIGGNLIIQHYRAVRTDPSDVEMYSAASTVYLLHLVPVAASVRWLLSVTPTTASTSEFTCTVEVQLHPVLRAMGRLMALGTFLKRHVDEETGGFAADITRKCRALHTA